MDLILSGVTLSRISPVSWEHVRQGVCAVRPSECVCIRTHLLVLCTVLSAVVALHDALGSEPCVSNAYGRSSTNQLITPRTDSVSRLFLHNNQQQLLQLDNYALNRLEFLTLSGSSAVISSTAPNSRSCPVLSCPGNEIAR